jgi:hypothetical protein
LEPQTLETFVNAQDIASNAALLCLGCRAELAHIRFVDHYKVDGTKHKKISLSVMTARLTDIRVEGKRIEIACECGVRSKFHMI